MAELTFYNRTNPNESLWDEERVAYVYRQYDGRGELKGRNWYVQVSTPAVVPRIRYDGKVVELVQHGSQPRCFILPDTVNAGAFAGDLKFYQDTNGVIPLKPHLHIDAANLTPDEVAAIIRRLQQLARQVNSPISIDDITFVNGSSGQSTSSTIPNTIKRAELFLELCQVVQKHWLLIVKTPARDVKLVPQVVDVSQYGKPLSASLVQRACQRPHARRVEALHPSETLNTAENRYIGFVFDKILKDKPERIADVTKYIEQLTREQYQMGEGFNQDELKRFSNRLAARRIAIINSIAKMNDLQESINCVVGSIDLWRRSKLLRDLKPSLPELPSLRLMQSDEYGPVFVAFSRYSREISTFFVPLKKGLETALLRMTLRPSWQLYERWLLLEIHGVLVEQFGFRPVRNKDGKFHPLEYIDVVHDEICDDELAGKNFVLQFDWPGRELPSITACLYYDKEVTAKSGGTKRPDLGLSFRYNDEKTNKTKTRTFIIDAKYRNYSDQGKWLYKVDTIDVAKMYCESIESISAAFVMHSDTNADTEKAYTFWGGEIGFNEAVSPNHRFGAVGVTPGDPLNVVRLLKCFFMYHMKMVDVCWSCCQKAKKSSRVLGVFDHECPNCESVWISAWCDNKGCDSRRYHHPDSECQRNLILKLGEHSFHSPSDDIKGQYHCPHCGKVKSKNKQY